MDITAAGSADGTAFGPVASSPIAARRPALTVNTAVQQAFRVFLRVTVGTASVTMDAATLELV
jgi:hypothetical protein